MKTVVIASGGMDSTTLLYDLINQGNVVVALSFNYGQRHCKELEYARNLCKELGVIHEIIDLSSLKYIFKGSSQTDEIEVPEGHYAAENMKLTVVPNRNMIMLSIATSYAIGIRFDRVAYAAHAGDHDIYPDCRPEFVQALNKSIELCDWNKMKLHAPYLNLTKGQIAEIGLKLNVPYEKTWTCYKGLEKPCGKCGACSERTEALEYAKTKVN